MVPLCNLKFKNKQTNKQTLVFFRYPGYISRGTVFPPADQRPSQQGYYTNPNNQSSVIATYYPRCNRWISAPYEGVTLAQPIPAPVLGSGPNCANPVAITLPSGLTGPVSRSFVIKPVITIAPCAASIAYNFTYSWTLSPNPTSIPTPPSSRLRIPANQLSPNTYTVSLTVTSSKLPTFSMSTAVVVQALPPVIVLTPAATNIEIGQYDKLLLDASGSYDPNSLAGAAVTPVTCYWSCRVLSSGGGSCGFDDPS